MIVDVDLVVFNCVFSRALDLNLYYYIKDIISHIIVHIILFFEKKSAGPPRRFHAGRRLYKRFSTVSDSKTFSRNLGVS
jgi:hypothetical protein